jgi:carboxylesterase type B
MPGKESRRCGAFHTSDVPYSFGYLSPLRAKWWTPADRALAEMMSSYLANFARTGDPNGDKLPVWNPFPTVLTAGPTPHQLTLLLTGKEKASWIKFF